jgi:dTDP-4-amino-4,6-dideoxygalactose transaminase
MPCAKHVYHLYVVQADGRDGLREQLASAGIESGLHYPVPLHLQEAFQYLNYSKGDFPVTERVTSRILSLPMYPGISCESIDQMAVELQEKCNVG